MLLLVKRIAQTIGKPFHEILEWPSSELDYWAACFSIDDNKNKPLLKRIKKDVTVEESIVNLRKVLS